LLPRERFGEFLIDDTPAYMPELGEAIHVFLARSRARLVLVQLEDAIGEGEQANLPGTSDSHPNWQRRLASQIEEIVAGSAMTRLAGRVGEARRQAASDTTSE
jgi:4-alpha-glucanotransferase